MKKVFIAIFLLMSLCSYSQLLSWSPGFPRETDANVTITVDANFGNKALVGFSGDVFVHIGCLTTTTTGATPWQYVKSTWGTTNSEIKATPAGTNKWSFTLSGASMRAYFGVTNPAEAIRKVAILFRNGTGSVVQRNADGSDMYVPVYGTGLQVAVTEPFRQPTYIPSREPINRTVGQTIPIAAQSSEAASLKLFFNGTQVNSLSGATSITANPVISAAGDQQIIAEAEVGGTTRRDTVNFLITSPTETAPLPAGVESNGVTYSPDGTSATLVLFAPNKSNIVVIGDFNNWTSQAAYQMKRTPDEQRYWLTINGLTPGQEYAYQYLIDGNLRVADYNTEKILDPWNDPWINEAPYTDRYPNLKPYPTGKATGIVSVLEPGKPQYQWSSATTNFVRPNKRNLVVYELLVRDFVARNDWKGMMDSLDYIAQLGVNAIHLMPFTEFEGNNSWGYNPSFMFAVDKFYGPENKLKEFIDLCHRKGIAVVLDLVLNHQFGQSPLAQMYWDAANSKPAANNPWLNPDAKHPFNVGYDMNHEATATIEFVERVMKHWLTKFKLDGFRWDLSKGFTQTNNPNNTEAWTAYDQSRVNIWKRIYDQSQVISPNCYMILEHLGVDQEEAELAKYGMILWGKMTDEFNENSMGYINSKGNFSRAWHKTRWSAYGGEDVPLLMAYAESHDEERLSWKNRNFGNSSNSFHDVKQMNVYARRQESIAAFLLTIPGPKLLWQFGELAYDSSINMCNTLKNDGCRVDPKPSGFRMPQGPNSNPSQPYNGPTINYNLVEPRANLRNTYSRLISLRTRKPEYLPTFTTSNIDYNLGGAVKWQWANTASLGLVTAGNFDVVTQSGNINFPSTGTWYVYAQNVGAASSLRSIVNSNFSADGSTINVTSSNMSFSIPAGSYLVLTDRAVTLPVTLYTFTGNGNWSDPANWAGGLVPPATVPAGVRVVIDPLSDFGDDFNGLGEAILDTNVTFLPGATLTVRPGEKLRVNGTLQRQ